MLITYDDYGATLRCRKCFELLREEPDRHPGYRTFRSCCIVRTPGDIFFVWMGPEKAQLLSDATQGRLGIDNELDFINQYAVRMDGYGPK
jgi:hypothetical protein